MFGGFSSSLLLVAFVLLQGLYHVTSSNEVFDFGSVVFDSHPPNPPAQITVGAYYYPWHYRHFQHSNAGYLRNQLSPRQELRLGEYDDREASVIKQHLEWSKQGNIGVWIASWWGPNSGEDQTLLGTIMNSSKVELGDHKIALLYETTGRIKADANGVYDYEKNVPSDFQYICQDSGYIDHPNYYRINGRPVIVMYLTRVLDSNSILDDVIPIIRGLCPNVYIIGDEVWGNPSGDTADLLDAITNYDVYGNMGRPQGYAGQGRVDDYFAKATAWKESDTVHQSAFVPSVSAGFNDRGVRLAKDHPAMSRRLTPTSPEGSLFAAQLVQAVELLDPEADHLLLVNSFNEWHEDTQIEPCDGLAATEPIELTQGLEYVGYGTLYLDILATYTQAVDSGFTSKLPVTFTGPPHAEATLAAYYFSWHTEEHFANGLRANLYPAQTSTFSLADDSVAVDLELSWRANIRTWITPWVSPSPHRTDIGAQSLFQHSYLEYWEHKVALHYELKARAEKQEDGSVTTDLLVSDIEYLCDNYFSDPSYFTTESGQPVLFLALSRAYSDSQLTTIVSTIREVSEGASCGKELFLVGDQVWGDFGAPTPYTPFSLLDAVMNHDVYGNMGEPVGYAGTTTVDNYYERQRRWRVAAWQEGCSFVPTVLPGYNDRAKRLDRDNPAMSRVLEEGGDEGSFFEHAVDLAKHLLDPRLNNLILINSLNHFIEDTQIYPVYGATTDLPVNYTQGLTYEAYGTLYLDLLSERFGSFELPSSAPSQMPTGMPSQFPTISPSSIPSALPSMQPSKEPTSSPSLVPTGNPTATASVSPTGDPTTSPSKAPSMSPSDIPSTLPSLRPSEPPSDVPSLAPTGKPTVTASATPSGQPTATPSGLPTVSPSSAPSSLPTAQPSQLPTKAPSSSPTGTPTSSPSLVPTKHPTASPSSQPTIRPVAPQWMTILEDGFEGGFTIFVDGGKDAKVDGKVKSDGSKSLKLVKGSGSSLAYTKNYYDVSNYSKLRWSFMFYTQKLKNGERFELQYREKGTSTWTTLKSYKKGTDFSSNDVWNSASEIFDVSGINGIQLQFRSYFSSKGSTVYIDSVLVEASL